MCIKCLDDTATTPDAFKDDSPCSAPPEDPDTEWDQLCDEIKKLRIVPTVGNNSRHIGLCNTPVEPKKVNLQPSPAPPPVVPLQDIRDSSPGPHRCEPCRVLVDCVGDGKRPDVALQAAMEDNDMIVEDVKEIDEEIWDGIKERPLEECFDKLTWADNWKLICKVEEVMEKGMKEGLEDGVKDVIDDVVEEGMEEGIEGGTEERWIMIEKPSSSPELNRSG